MTVAADSANDAEPVLVRIRLRLPGDTGFFYVLQQSGGVVDERRFPGAEPLLTRAGRVVAAHSPSVLVSLNTSLARFDDPIWPRTPVLDVRRVNRAIERPIDTWSGRTRGTLADFDDLCWDAAASVGDTDWASQIKDDDGWHQLYNFVWGSTSTLPGPVERRRLWQQMSGAFRSHIEVVP